MNAAARLGPGVAASPAVMRRLADGLRRRARGAGVADNLEPAAESLDAAAELIESFYGLPIVVHGIPGAPPPTVCDVPRHTIKVEDLVALVDGLSRISFAEFATILERTSGEPRPSLPEAWRSFCEKPLMFLTTRHPRAQAEEILAAATRLSSDRVERMVALFPKVETRDADAMLEFGEVMLCATAAEVNQAAERLTGIKVGERIRHQTDGLDRVTSFSFGGISAEGCAVMAHTAGGRIWPAKHCFREVSS